MMVLLLLATAPQGSPLSPQVSSCPEGDSPRGCHTSRSVRCSSSMRLSTSSECDFSSDSSASLLLASFGTDYKKIIRLLPLPNGTSLAFRIHHRPTSRSVRCSSSMRLSTSSECDFSSESSADSSSLRLLSRI
jgi:hypothetical protein